MTDLADAEEIALRDEPNGGAMRLFLAEIALERCRIALAKIGVINAGWRLSDKSPVPEQAPAPPARSAWPRRIGNLLGWSRASVIVEAKPAPPAVVTPPKVLTWMPATLGSVHPTSPRRKELLGIAEQHWRGAADLVAATGYRRRTNAISELRMTLDALR